jgi:hypothetical protein
MEHIQAVANVLAGTFNPDGAVRQQAEKSLNDFSNQPGYLPALLALIHARQQYPNEIRQSAAIQLKQNVRRYWARPKGVENKINENDRNLLKQKFVESVVQEPQQKISVQLLAAMLVGVRIDFPDQWPSLLPEIMHNLNSGDTTRTFGGLRCLKVVMKKYRHKSANSRNTHLATVISTAFPKLLQIASSIFAAPTADGVHALHYICKIFHFAINMSVPEPLYNAQALNPWMDMLRAVVRVPLPQEFHREMDPDDLKEIPIYKAKKWAMRAVHRIFSRYGRPAVVSESEVDFANFVFSTYSGPILNDFMGLLHLYHSGTPMSKPMLQIMYEYLTICMQHASLYAMIKPKLQFILLNCVFRTMCLNSHDLYMFEHDPQEFMSKSWDLMQEFVDPRTAAVNVLIAALKLRTADSLDPVLNFVTSTLNTYTAAPPDQKQPILKEGALNMLGAMKKLLLSKENFKPAIRNILLQHVFTEAKCPLGYMRSRVMTLLGQYNQLGWDDENHKAFTIRLAVEYLVDSDLPVKLEAARTISRLVKDSEILKFIKPHIPFILTSFFGLIDEIGSETVISTLGTLIHKVGQDMAPFAVDMMRKLVAMFQKLLQADEEDDEAMLSAQECMRAINSILYACEKSPELYAPLEDICFPFMDHLIQEAGLEYYEDVLESVLCITLFAPAISPRMWSLYPRFIESFHTFAPDYLDKMLAPLDNYISRANDLFVSCQNPNFLGMTLSIPEKLFSMQNMNVEGQYACKLLEGILAHSHGKIDAVVPDIIKMTVVKLFNTQSLALKLLLLDVVAVSCHYNTMMFLQTVNSMGTDAVGNLINFWLSHLPEMKKSKKHQKMAVVGLASLCQLPLTQMPQVLAQGFHAVLEQMLNVLGNVFAEQNAAQERKAKRAAETGNPDYNEEDDNSDYDDFEDGVVDFEALADDQDGDFADASFAAFQNEIEGLGEEIVDEENFSSPLDDIDAFICTANAFYQVSTLNAEFWQQFQASLRPELVQVLGLTMQEGQARSELKQKAAQEKKTGEDRNRGKIVSPGDEQRIVTTYRMLPDGSLVPHNE